MHTLLSTPLGWGPHAPIGPHGPLGPHGPTGTHAGAGPLQWLGMPGGGAVVLWLTLLVTLAVVVLAAGVVLSVRRREGSTPASGTATDDPALVTLRRRYARGEIDDEEFDRRTERLAADTS